MSTRCQLDWKSTQSVAISGEIDEHADFSSFNKLRGQKIYVDFSGVTRLNSSGVRSWIQTIMKNKIQLVLRECSPVVVEQYSLVPQFIGQDGKVESFFARYHCNACTHETLKRFQIGHNLSSSDPKLPLNFEKPCPDCGDVLELDQSPDIYLSIFRKATPGKPSTPGDQAS